MAKPFGPEEVGASLIYGDYVVVVEARVDPLLLAPHAAAVRELGPHIAVVEEGLPLLGTALAKLLKVVGDFQQTLTMGTAIDDLRQTVTSGASEAALKPGVEFHE